MSITNEVKTEQTISEEYLRRKIDQTMREYFRRNKGRFSFTIPEPEETPESEKSEYYKIGEQIAEEVMRKVFDEIEQEDEEYNQH